MTTPNRAAEFREALAQRVLVADGAMGTMLYSKGAFINRCYDELNLSLPALVRDVHREYLRAGAEIIETNTFGANRKRLGAFGFAEKVKLINRAGVRIAREAADKGDAGDQAFVAGAVGPLGVHVEPLGSTTLAEARAIFREQIDALVEAGVDLLIFETFQEVGELLAAVDAARESAGPDMVVVAMVTIEDDGTLRGGGSTETFTSVLNGFPVDVIGLNCSSGPRVMLDTLEKMVKVTDKPLAAMPNAGLPTTVDGRNIYLCSPEYMAHYARKFMEMGVRIVGGCCGTAPEHIKQMRSEARAFEALSRGALRPGETPGIERATTVTDEHRSGAAVHPAALEKVPVAARSQLGAKLAAGRFVAFVEILPPRGLDATKEIEGARLCKAAGIDAINVPDGPRASARLSAPVTCQIIQEQAGIEAVLHFCCRDRNILSIQSELLGAHATGIRNLICITGDPPRMGAYPNATAVFDVDSIGLVSIVNNLNQGLDLGGNALGGNGLGSQTSLLIGVGADPGSLHMDNELRRLESKIKAGAEYIVTQPVFDLNLLEAFVRHTEQYKIPVLAGIWPLTSFRNAEFMVNELRVPVPESYMERMRRVENAEDARAEGVAIAQEMVERARGMVAGVQLSAPFGRYQMAVDVAGAIGPR
jgi:methionine synthase I (cobalamin-dependent)/5,10-methylenetetrahydrofolate reductase